VANPSLDPELIRQLDEARKSGDTVEAVVSLQRKAGQMPVPSVVEVQAGEAIQRASSASGEAPSDVHVMPNMAAAYVSGSERFLRELMAQPEIASAVANVSHAME
jgi:pyrroline-5-carboxylate reductase